MKKEFMKVIYNQSLDQTTSNGLHANLEQRMRHMESTIHSYNGRWMDDNALNELSDLVNRSQMINHEEGFYEGFEMACSILREMMGGVDRV